MKEKILDFYEISRRIKDIEDNEDRDVFLNYIVRSLLSHPGDTLDVRDALQDAFVGSTYEENEKFMHFMIELIDGVHEWLREIEYDKDEVIIQYVLSEIKLAEYHRLISDLFEGLID